ncbi:MAG: cupin domain-containing protein [Chromatiaceae bacterium]|nr:cupin domain-containing protein [Chromatiaceae bacterium]
MLRDEVVKDEPGQAAVLDRLLDLLLTAVLKAWFSQNGIAASRSGGDFKATESLNGRCAECTTIPPIHGRWTRLR